MSFSCIRERQSTRRVWTSQATVALQGRTLLDLAVRLVYVFSTLAMTHDISVAHLRPIFGHFFGQRVLLAPGRLSLGRFWEVFARFSRRFSLPKYFRERLRRAEKPKSNQLLRAAGAPARGPRGTQQLGRTVTVRYDLDGSRQPMHNLFYA